MKQGLVDLEGRASIYGIDKTCDRLGLGLGKYPHSGDYIFNLSRCADSRIKDHLLILYNDIALMLEQLFLSDELLYWNTLFLCITMFPGTSVPSVAIPTTLSTASATMS